MRAPSLRPRWPTALLAVAVLLIVAGVAEVTRAVRAQEETTRRVVRDYSRFAAWSYRQHVTTVLGGALSEVLGAVNHGENLHLAPGVPPAWELAHYLQTDPRCGCHRPRFGPSPAVFFGFALGSDTLGLGINTHPRPAEGWEVDRLSPSAVDEVRQEYDPALVRRIVDTLTRQVRAWRTVDRMAERFVLVVVPHAGRSRYLAYTLMPTVRGDTIVYGAEYTRGALEGLLGGARDRGPLLPATFLRGRGTSELLRLEVRDPRGGALLAAGDDAPWRLDARDTLPRWLGGLAVRAELRPAMAEQVVIGGLPRSRLPFLVALLALAAALSVVATAQVRRDVELARLRGDFVSSVSHELRTPLAQMRLYLETLRLGRYHTEAQRAASIAHVERETTRLSQLVERVLAFQATQRGGGDAPRVAVDPAREVDDVVREFGPLAQLRRVTVVAEAASVPPLALAPDALRHVLLNLLDNAVKYGPAGQTVRVEVTPAPGEVRFAVSDEGPGVPVAEREAVWAPYRRGDTHAAVAGSGIGLSIVREVAARHGGRAWIEDAPMRGARVVVALPVAP